MTALKLVMAAAVILVCSLAFAQPATASRPATATGPTTQAVPGDVPPEVQLNQMLDILNKAVKLAEQQQAQIKQKFMAKQVPIDDWNKANQAKLEQARKAYATAFKTMDEDQVNRASMPLHVLMAQRQRLLKAQNDEVMSVLTPEQKTAWAAFHLNMVVKNAYARFNLTAEQTAKAEDMCLEVAKQVDLDSLDDSGLRNLYHRLFALIHEKVLTEEQRKSSVMARPAGIHGVAPGNGPAKPSQPAVPAK
jgi:hypothetical protein